MLGLGSLSNLKAERSMRSRGRCRERRAAAAPFRFFSACRRFRPAIDALVGVLCCVMARSMIVSVDQGSEHDAQKGHHVGFHLNAVRANISKLKFWKCF